MTGQGHAVNFLRTHRYARQLSETELADLAGTSPAVIRNAEAGKSTPRPATQEALAEALGAEVKNVFPAVKQ